MAQVGVVLVGKRISAHGIEDVSTLKSERRERLFFVSAMVSHLLLAFESCLLSFGYFIVRLWCVQDGANF